MITDWNKLQEMKRQRAEDSRMRRAQQLANREVVQSFWDSVNNVLLPDGMKADIAATQTVFDVYAVRDGKGKFGPCWFVDVILNDQKFTIVFAHNNARDPIMLAMKDALPEYGTVPATLREFEAELGTGYDLTQPPDEWWRQLALETGDHPDAPNAVEAGPNDDVPF